MPKTVIHVFHDDPSSLSTAAHLSERIRQVKDERGVELEVYVFGPAEKALVDGGHAEFSAALDELARRGVPVVTCIDIAQGLDAEETFKARGFRLEYAREAFVRYALEGATVISF
jgi:hypothetical protein